MEDSKLLVLLNNLVELLGIVSKHDMDDVNDISMFCSEVFIYLQT